MSSPFFKELCVQAVPSSTPGKRLALRRMGPVGSFLLAAMKSPSNRACVSRRNAEEPKPASTCLFDSPDSPKRLGLTLLRVVQLPTKLQVHPKPRRIAEVLG